MRNYSSSGMAGAGRAKHYIKNNIDNPKNTILMVGYCEPNSLGGHLLRHYREVLIFGEKFEVKAAHSDYEDLLHFISCQDPEKVKQILLVHGEHEV